MSRKKMVAVYDLAVSPATFDVLAFLSMARMKQFEVGADDLIILLVPGPDHGFRDGDPERHNLAQWRYRHILVESIIVFSPDSDAVFLKKRELAEAILATSKWIFPEGYRLDHPIACYNTKAHVEAIRSSKNPAGIWLEANKEARVLARKYIDSRSCGRKAIVITLRQCPYQVERNSDIDSWLAFAGRLDAKEYCPIFIPDTDAATRLSDRLEGFEVCSIASFNLEFRVGLYAEAYLNLMVNNGPALACYKQRDSRYLSFKPMVENCSSSGLEVYQKAKWLPGSHLPGSNELQRYVWEDDRESVITLAFEEMVQVIQGNKRDADSIMNRGTQALNCNRVLDALDFSAVAISFFGENHRSWYLRIDALSAAGRWAELLAILGQPILQEEHWGDSDEEMSRLLNLVILACEHKQYQVYRRLGLIYFSKEKAQRALLASRLGLIERETCFDLLWNGSTSKVVIFGAGQAGRNALYDLEEKRELVAFLDNDSSRQGCEVAGIPVLAPHQLSDVWPCRVLIASMFSEEIKLQLLKAGLPEECIKIVD